MANLKAIELQSAMELGSPTFYSAPEPEIPDQLEQARVVANYLQGWDKHILAPPSVETYRQLRSGKLDLFFSCFTQANIDEYKKKTLVIEKTDLWLARRREEWLKRQTLPPEEKLVNWFRIARAALWVTENGLPITWAEWDRLRHKVEVGQIESLADLWKDPKTKRLSARRQAELLARSAVTLESRTPVEVASLAETLLDNMFISDRICLPLHDRTPVQLPLEIPIWVWEGGLRALSPLWWSPRPSSDAAADIETDPGHLQRMLSGLPYAFIDRATRDGRNWKYDPEEEHFPYFEDGRTNGMRITYGSSIPAAEDVQLAAKAAVEQVNLLDDRTADVWRVILWKATERGVSNSNFYTRIRIDTREVAQALGYKNHHKGGMKPEHLLEVHHALLNLERMNLYLTPAVKGTLERDTGQAKGKRKKQPLVKAREEKVISVMAREVDRNLLGQECHMVWELALGDWSRIFPPSYAPMFKALVQLPSRSGVHKWAKRIGTELVLLYRQDAQRGKKIKRLKWSTILDRAGLMNEIGELRASPNRSRITRYAEGAMEALKEIGVVENWRVDPRDLKRVNDGIGKPGNFETWLDAVVEITTPEEVVKILNTIAPPKKRRPTPLQVNHSPPSK